MLKLQLIIGLGVAIILIEISGFTDSMKTYLVVTCALAIVLFAVWHYSESKDKHS